MKCKTHSCVSRGLVFGLFFFSVFFLLSDNVFSQSGFNKTFDLGRSLWLRDIDYSIETQLVSAGIYYNDTSNRQNIIAVQLDTFGNVLKTVEISDPVKTSHLVFQIEGDVIINSKHQLVIPFGFYNRNTLGIAFVDFNKDSVLIKEFSIDSVNYINPFSLIEVVNGYLVTGSWNKTSEINIDAYVIKFNESGDILWMKNYGDINYRDISRTIFAVNNNHFILGGASFYNNENAVSWAVAIDSTGNEKWTWKSDSIELFDNGILTIQYNAVSEKLNYISLYSRKSFYPGEDFNVSVPVLVTCDTLFNERSYSPISPYAFNHRITEIGSDMSGKIVVAGNTTLTTDQYLSPVKSTRGEFVKFSATGEREWTVQDTAFYTAESGSDNRINGMCIAPNGTVYAVGEADHVDQSGTPRSFGWLIKISSDGCIDTICKTSSHINQKDLTFQRFKLYPNPASDQVLVSGSNYTLQRHMIILYDAMGNVKFSKVIDSQDFEIDLSSFIDGLYYWIVTTDQGLLLDAGSLIVLK